MTALELIAKLADLASQYGDHEVVLDGRRVTDVWYCHPSIEGFAMGAEKHYSLEAGPAPDLSPKIEFYAGA
jgi:hypothetical protein